jgi:hypothetical protein
LSLSFEQKISIFEDPQYELIKYTIKPNKTNFKYKGKVVVREMREGSKVAYVWGKEVSKLTGNYKVDNRGWIHAHDFTEQEIRDLLEMVISIRDKLIKD